jgi:hypothetical protein
MSTSQLRSLVDDVASQTKDFLQSQHWGQHVLTVILAVWATYIIRQFVYSLFPPGTNSIGSPRSHLTSRCLPFLPMARQYGDLWHGAIQIFHQLSKEGSSYF